MIYNDIYNAYKVYDMEFCNIISYWSRNPDNGYASVNKVIIGLVEHLITN